MAKSGKDAGALSGKLLLFALLLLTSNAVMHAFTRLKADEQIVFYPTIAQRVPGKDAWRLEVHGCVFEPEKRSLTLARRETLDLRMLS
jgi:hypothetical protein